MNITVGIPTYQRPNLLIDTCNQVIKQNHPALLEIIIADQTPWDHLSQFAQDAILDLKKHSKVRYFSLNKANLPSARNFILQKAKGDIILWIDDDVLLPQGFIEEHYRIYKNNNNCSRQIIALAGNPYHRVRDIEDLSVINFENYSKYCSPHFPNDTQFRCHWPKGMVGANHSVLKKFAILSLGYDENFLGSAGYEDTDFTHRLKKTFPEKVVAFNPSAWLIHLRGKTGGCRIEKKNKWNEYDTIIGPQICRIRHNNSVPISNILRMSPLRKENIIKPWRQPLAWLAFFNTLLNAYLLKRKIKSPFTDA